MFKGKRRGKRRFKKGGLSKKAKNEVKKMISVEQELKEGLVNQNNVAITAASDTLAYESLMDGLVQGVGESNARVGNKLKLKSLNLICTIKADPTAQNANAIVTVRMVVFQWHPTLDGTYANIKTNLPLSTIFELGATTIVDPTSQYNWDYRQSYTILYDKLFTFSSPGNAANLYPTYDTHGIRRDFHKRISLKKARKIVSFQGTSSHISSNQIMIALFQYNNNAVNNPPVVFYTTRLTYTDS